jgi:hypothetical protein
LVVQAVTRVREESELRDHWDRTGDRSQWLAAVNDLLARVERAGAGRPPSVAP